MIDLTTRFGSRHGRALWCSAAALLLLATGCKTSSASSAKNPSISVDETRNSAGVLQGVKIHGSQFSANGPVHLTFLLAASGSQAEPYVEADTQADANGEFTFERRPLECPQPADYGHGSWIRVSARDTSSGIADTESFHAGREPDC